MAITSTIPLSGRSPLFAKSSQKRSYAKTVSAKASGCRPISERFTPSCSKRLSAILFSACSFDELEDLSTHTRPQEVSDLEVSVGEITPETLCFSGTGTVCCSLQIGSDGDCRRGDGLEWDESLPFAFNGTANTQSLDSVKVDPNDVHVDTSKYWEDYVK